MRACNGEQENGRVPRKTENTQLQISLFWCGPLGRGCRDLGRGPEPGCWSLPAFQTCTMQSFGLQSDASESFCLPCAIATAAGFSWSAWLILEMTHFIFRWADCNAINKHYVESTNQGPASLYPPEAEGKCKYGISGSMFPVLLTDFLHPSLYQLIP